MDFKSFHQIHGFMIQKKNVSNYKPICNTSLIQHGCKIPKDLFVEKGISLDFAKISEVFNQVRSI